MINAQVLIDASSHTSDAIKVTIICHIKSSQWSYTWPSF